MTGTDIHTRIEAYVVELADGLYDLPDSVRQDVESEVRAILGEAMEDAVDAADVDRIFEGLGDPTSLAARYREANRVDETRLAGSVLGMPYDWRAPTPERVGARWWDPMNPKVLVPRAFGVGWSVNFGALAVLVGLARPDDDDEPFEFASERALRGALAVPVAVLGGLVVLVALFHGGLPDAVPRHWGVNGPDAYWDKNILLALSFVFAGAPTAAAVRRFIARRSATRRAFGAAFATLLAGLAVSIYATVVLWASGFSSGWTALVAITSSLALTFIVLLALARSSVRTQIDRSVGREGRMRSS